MKFLFLFVIHVIIHCMSLSKFSYYTDLLHLNELIYLSNYVFFWRYRSAFFFLNFTNYIIYWKLKKKQVGTCNALNNENLVTDKIRIYVTLKTAYMGVRDHFISSVGLTRLHEVGRL